MVEKKPQSNGKEQDLWMYLARKKMLFTFAVYILDILVDVFSQSILNSMNSIIYNWDRSLQKFFFPQEISIE